MRKMKMPAGGQDMLIDLITIVEENQLSTVQTQETLAAAW
jgi:hypothetical protein